MSPNALRNAAILVVLSCGPFLAFAGCLPTRAREVVVYSALDQEFSEPILESFQRKSGIDVRPKYDVESTKTVGLTTELIQEQSRPRCDVFWNNEILHTLRLRRLGLLAPYASPEASRFPAEFRSAEGLWYGFAARVRVLIVNTELVPADQRPDSVQDLVAPRWQGQVGIAKPLFGTTATHVAVWYALWGPERAEAFLQQLKDNAVVLSGNKQVAIDVASGRLAFGLTDTDDAIIEQEKGAPVAIVYPDQAEGQIGALFIPNTLALLKDSPNPAAGRQLIDYLLSGDIEGRLAMGDSAQFPLGDAVNVNSRAAPDAPLKRMKVDFEAAADQWETAQQRVRDLFTR